MTTTLNDLDNVFLGTSATITSGTDTTTLTSTGNDTFNLYETDSDSSNLNGNSSTNAGSTQTSATYSEHLTASPTISDWAWATPPQSMTQTDTIGTNGLFTAGTASDGDLSSYANAWARRHHFGGHVFQGRYRTELVEDETYLWTVTLYVHLNPVRAGLVEHPSAWRWSSYPGYADRRRRVEWLAYDGLLESWAGEFGGSDAAAAYRRYVTAGLSDPPSSPWSAAHHGWALGGAAFVARISRMVRDGVARQPSRESRMMRGIALETIRDLVCRSYNVTASELSRWGSRQERERPWLT